MNKLRCTGAMSASTSDCQQAYLSLGSNLEDRAALIDEAIRLLDGTPGIVVTGRSGFYRTPPWGGVDQGDFLNVAVEVATTLDPHALLDSCLDIEHRLGRVRERRWGPRVIDIDILHYVGRFVADARLTLPHPFWSERAFVLVPIHEIAPDLVIDGTPVRDALARVDRDGIERMSPGEPT